MSLPTQQDYERREVRRHMAEITAIEKSPVSERRDGAASLLDCLKNAPDRVLQSVEWYLNGSFGAGAVFYLRGLEAKPRTKAIMAFREACILDFRTSAHYVTKAFKEVFPTKEAQEAFNAKLIKLVNEQE